MEAASSAALSCVDQENIGLNATVKEMGIALCVRMVLCPASYLYFEKIDVNKFIAFFCNCFVYICIYIYIYIMYMLFSYIYI